MVAVYTGFWNDGLSAHREEVRVQLVGRMLVLTGIDGRSLLSLPVSGLQLTEEVYPGRPLRFAHRDHPDVRLTVADHALLRQLRELAPALGRRDLSRHRTLVRLLGWGGALAATVAALLVAIPLAARPLALGLPDAWEAALGEGVANAMLAGEHECAAPAGRGVLVSLTARLADVTAAGYVFDVRVVADDTVNAFAAPGGHIVLLDGLLQHAASPEMLAAVLAHEMAHALERHATQALLRRAGFRVVVAGLAGDLSGALAFVAESGELLLNLAHSRSDEAAADRRALAILQQAGIDSTGLSAFFEQLAEEERTQPPEALRLLSTHPLHAERVAQARQLEGPGGPALSAEEWQALRSICSDREPAGKAG